MFRDKVKIYKIIALLNILIITCIYADYFYPVKPTVTEEFAAFTFKNVKLYRKYGGATNHTNYYVECNSGTTYFIKKMPDYESEFVAGDRLTITKTFFFGKVISIGLQKGNKVITENIALLNSWLIAILYILALAISVYGFICPETASGMLGFVTVIIFGISFFYIF